MQQLRSGHGSVRPPGGGILAYSPTSGVIEKQHLVLVEGRNHFISNPGPIHIDLLESPGVRGLAGEGMVVVQRKMALNAPSNKPVWLPSGAPLVPKSASADKFASLLIYLSFSFVQLAPCLFPLGIHGAYTESDPE